MANPGLEYRKPDGRYPSGFPNQFDRMEIVMAKFIVVHGIRVAKDFTPETFGRLTTLGPVFKAGKRNYQVCQCSCGTVRVAEVTAMKCGNTQSCGCLRNEETSKRSKTHGRSNTPEHWAWKNMLKRCNNPKATQYKDYGGRGIKVCQRWSRFEYFLDDMGKKPTPGHSLDRIDVNGNYCPENCRWATVEEQCNNTRSNRTITAFGKTQTLAQWAKELEIPSYCIRLRIDRYKWSVEKSLSHPVRNWSKTSKTKEIP